jgi:hypothetical protein
MNKYCSVTGWFEIVGCKYYPLRTQKTLNIAGLVTSFIETTLPFLSEWSLSKNIFSANDANNNLRLLRLLRKNCQRMVSAYSSIPGF